MENSFKKLADDILPRVNGGINKIIIPVSGIIPTKDRANKVEQLLESLVAQSAQPAELIFVDASEDDRTECLMDCWRSRLHSTLIYHRAIIIGAAAQRNQAMLSITQPFILFLDDDIVFEQDCLLRLWRGIESDVKLGGVNAMISNQRYTPPGRVSQLLFRFLSGRHFESYAGRCIGPALNLLPEDRDGLPEIVNVEWLNLGSTLYRREALPNPVFAGHFTGYSMMEDLTLSLTVGRRWKLANIRTARIYHDSVQSGDKQNPYLMARMELVNRHYVMRSILGRKRLSDYLRLSVLQLFGILNSMRTINGLKQFPWVITGKVIAIADIGTELWKEKVEGK